MAKDSKKISKKTGRFKRLFGRTLRGVFSLFLSGIIVLALLYMYMEMQLPDVERLKDVHLQVPLRIMTNDNKLIAQFGSKRRIPVSLNEVPILLRNAVLATEDARFYEHPGVDFVGIARAAVAVISSGRKVQGASTITMQVARNFYLSREKTFSRKIREILLALKIDREISKDKILELYLNKIYFGNRAYGVAAAAKVYYGKELDELSLAQMAMIAGLPQAPSRNNPIRNPKAALKRRNHVLQRMLDVKFISTQQYQEAVKQPITATFHSQGPVVNAPYVAEMVREAMIEQYGKGAYEKGLTVTTTLNSDFQQDANVALRDGLIDYDKRHGFRKPTLNLGDFNHDRWLQALKKESETSFVKTAAVMNILPRSIRVFTEDGELINIPWTGLSWARPELHSGYVGALPTRADEIVSVGDVVHVIQRDNGAFELAQLPEVQGAIVAMDPNNGAILALMGGFNYKLSSFNRVTQAERQPGSNFKPFIYSAALNKKYTLATLINDAPIVQEDSGENQLWRPTNDTLKFYGPTSLRMGLIKSRNLVSIRLLQGIGIPYALQYVKRFGFDPNTLPNTLSLALGSGTVTPLQIATGYSVFANGGYRVKPYFIERITGQNDKLLYRADVKSACLTCITHPLVASGPGADRYAERVITPQNAYLMTQAMRDVIRLGTGRAALILKRNDLAGKTGTTNKQADAWFSGFNSRIVTTVWVGFDNLKSLKEYGAQAALPVWIKFMKTALKGTPEFTMQEPPGMVTVRIDPKTGLLATPHQQDAQFEVFRQQNVPEQYANEVVAHPEQTRPSSDSGTTAGSPSSSDDKDSSSNDDEHIF